MRTKVAQSIRNSDTSVQMNVNQTRRLHRRSLRLPTRRKWVQSGYLGTTAQAGADADISLP